MEPEQQTEGRWGGLTEVLGMAWPIVLGSVSFTVMQFVDQILVSLLGKAAFAAVSPSGLWAFVTSTFVLGIVGCVSTFVSQSLGRGEKDNCARYAWQGIYVSVAAGVLVLALWPAANPLFTYMHHGPDVTKMEIAYFRIRLLGYMFMAWQAGLTNFFQAVRRPLIPMAAAIIANVVNVGLAVLLIFGLCGFPRWEVSGAAAATVIALGVQALLLQAVFLTGRTSREYGTRTAYAFDMVKIRELFRIGWPSGFSFLMDVLNWGVFTSFMVGHFGDTALAAHNASTNFMQLSFMPAVGLNWAIAPIVGRWIGRGDIARAVGRTYTAMRIAIVYMFSVGILLAVFGKPLIRLCFSQDPDVIKLGHTLLIFAAVFQAFDAVNITLMGALRGAGDTRFIAVAMVVAGYVFFLPIAAALAFWMGWGAIGAWAGATIYIIGLSVVLFVRFRGQRWREIQIFTKERVQETPAG